MTESELDQYCTDYDLICPISHGVCSAEFVIFYFLIILVTLYAITNYIEWVVIAYAKILILKQVTTGYLFVGDAGMLLLPMQR